MSYLEPIGRSETADIAQNLTEQVLALIGIAQLVADLAGVARGTAPNSDDAAALTRRIAASTPATRAALAVALGDISAFLHIGLEALLLAHRTGSVNQAAAQRLRTEFEAALAAALVVLG